MNSDATILNLPTPFLEDPMWIYPLGGLSVVTALKQRGYQAELLDLAPMKTGEALDIGIVKALKTIKSEVIGMSVSTPQFRFLPLILSTFRKDNRKLIVGGPHATIKPQDLDALGFDTVVAGEAETAIPAMMNGGTGVIKAEITNDLDSLPFPDRSLISGYNGPIPIMAMRGCPFSCSFCSKAYSTKIRMRSPENIVEEILEIQSRYPDKDEIIFYDDTFTFDNSWVEKLCEIIVQKNIRKKFRCSTRADRISLSLAKTMKQAGFEEICVGVESGSQKILDTLKKHTTPSMNSRARLICREADLRFKAYIMLGSPGEDYETIRETEMWLQENRPDSVGLYLFHPLPGSDIWDNPSQYDLRYNSTDYAFTYYGGQREEMISTVATSALSKRALTRIYWQMLDQWGMA